MARPTRSQPALFDPALPPPIRLPRLLRADAVALLKILLGEAAPPSAVVSRASTAGEVVGDEQDHA